MLALTHWRGGREGRKTGGRGGVRARRRLRREEGRKDLGGDRKVDRQDGGSQNETEMGRRAKERKAQDCDEERKVRQEKKDVKAGQEEER